MTVQAKGVRRTGSDQTIHRKSPPGTVEPRRATSMSECITNHGVWEDECIEPYQVSILVRLITIALPM